MMNKYRLTKVSNHLNEITKGAIVGIQIGNTSRPLSDKEVEDLDNIWDDMSWTNWGMLYVTFIILELSNGLPLYLSTTSENLDGIFFTDGSEYQ